MFLLYLNCDYPQELLQYYLIFCDHELIYNLKVEKENFVDIYGRMLWYFSIENKTYAEMILEKWLSKVYEKYNFNKKS